MQQLVAYWIGTLFRAIYSFPEFIGSNRVGVLLSLAFLVPRWWAHLKQGMQAKPIDAGWRWSLKLAVNMAQKTNWRTVGIILGSFLLGDMLTISFRDQKLLAGENSRLAANVADDKINCSTQVSEATKKLNIIVSNLNQENSAASSTIKILTAQVRSQQDTINGFGSQIIKATIQPVKTIPYALSLDTSNTLEKTTKWIVLTNRVITSATVQVQCSGPFWITSVRVLGGNDLVDYAPKSLLPNLWDIILPSAWTPTTPLLVGTATSSDANMTCFFVGK